MYDMSRSKSKPPLWMLVGFLLGLCLTFQAATQFIAHQLHYQKALGAPLIGNVYAPWAWLSWRFSFYDQLPRFFDQVGLAVNGAILVLITAGMSLHLVNQRKLKSYEGLHGTARWASQEDIEQTGLLASTADTTEGVMVGGWIDKRGRGHYLRSNGPEHLMVLAPTRTGKGISLVIPSLLHWKESVVVHDLKGELWEYTAAWRAHPTQGANNRVIKFDPASPEGSWRFNPLLEIRLNSPHSVGDTQNLVTIIVDPDGKGMESHWAKTAHAFLTGLILHLLSLDANATLYDVSAALSDHQHPLDKLLEEMINNKHRDLNIRQAVSHGGQELKTKADKERSSVISTAASFLSLYRDPIVRKNTEFSDFRISDLMNEGQPISLYLVASPANKDRLRPLMRLMINQIGRILMAPKIQRDLKTGQPVSPHKHRLLFLLDEFPSLGRLPIFEESLAYMAGYGMKAYIITQDLAQLWAAYGKEETISSNCSIRIAFAPNKQETAEWLSDLCGKGTKIILEQSQSGSKWSWSLKNISQHLRHVERPLMTSGEIKELPGLQKDKTGTIVKSGDMLIFVNQFPPIYGVQPLYFQNPEYLKRSMMKLEETPVHAT